MAVTTTGNHLRINDVDTNANIIANDGTAKHGRIYLSNGSGYEIYIGNHDGSLSKLTAKATSTSVWGVSTTGYHDNIQATTDGHVLRRSGGVLGFGTITSSSISDVGTIIQGSGITLSGTLTNRLVGSGNLTIAHADTSSFSKSSLTGATVISNLTVDTYGHITDWTTRNLQISDIISLPNNQIAYGTGSGISSNGNLKYNGNSGLQIGGGTNTAYCAINIGNGVITNHSDFSFVLTENTANVISGLGSAVASFIIGSGNTITTGDITSSAYHNKIFGFNNSISAAPSKAAYYNFISGRDNIVTDGYYNNILGHNVTNNGYYGCLALTDYGGSITLTANNQFTARFSGGYRFMKDGSTQWMAIAPTTGYVTINNIPTAASATDILVSNGGVVSTRTVASLGIPVITPAALTKTDDTNVTISLGGTPATALLQGVSLTMGWTGVLAISRGGTGLGTLGTANQLLRVNSSATALEYFTPDWTSNTGTVTSFSAGNLSPLFTTNVATPTTTPALSFNLSNCNQYQVFGRVAAGTGAPSYVTLNPIAFNGLAIPNREVVFGTGTGVSSSSGFKYTTLESVQIGTGTATGTYSFQMGAGSVASNYTMNIGGGIVNNRGNVSLIICESGSEISGSSNANLSVLIGGNNNKIIAGTATYGNVIMGASNTVTSTTGITIYNRILGNDNTITDAYYNNILGISNNISSSGAYSAYYNDIIGYSNSISGTTSNAYHNKIIGVNNTISNGGYNNTIGRYCNNGGYSGVLLLGDGDSSTLTATASNQFNSRFSGGYRFMQNGSTQWMAIAPTTGYVTINNIPTASSSVNLLTTNGGVIETRTIASLGFLTTSTAATTYVPYIGATNDVDLGSNNFKIGNNIGTRNITLASGNSTGDASYIMFKRGGSNKLLIGNDCAAFGGNNDNTTIFAYGNNSVNIATNGVRRLIVDGNGYVTINNIPTAASATDILVSNGGVVSTRSLSSLNIPTALWQDSGGYIEPLSNSWIQLKPVVGKGSVRLSSDNDSGIIEVFNDDSSQTLTIKSDSNDDVSYNIKTGKTHKFNEKISIGYIPTNTTSTSYLVDNSGVIEKRSLPIASSSTLGVIKIGDTLQIDGNGVVNTYLQDDFVYDFRLTDVTNNSDSTLVDAMRIPLSVGLWEVNIIAGYKFETTSTGARIIMDYSDRGFTMHGKLAATINSNNNSEITSKTASSGIDISSVNTANSEYALTGKIIILATVAGDLSLNFLSFTNGSTVTIMQYSAMTARKLNTHAP